MLTYAHNIVAMLCKLMINRANDHWTPLLLALGNKHVLFVDPILYNFAGIYVYMTTSYNLLNILGAPQRFATKKKKKNFFSFSLLLDKFTLQYAVKLLMLDNTVSIFNQSFKK